MGNSSEFGAGIAIHVCQVSTNETLFPSMLVRVELKLVMVGKVAAKTLSNSYFPSGPYTGVRLCICGDEIRCLCSTYASPAWAMPVAKPNPEATQATMEGRRAGVPLDEAFVRKRLLIDFEEFTFVEATFADVEAALIINIQSPGSTATPHQIGLVMQLTTYATKCWIESGPGSAGKRKAFGSDSGLLNHMSCYRERRVRIRFEQRTEF